MATCKRCNKSFKLFPKVEKLFMKDGLCGKCRGRQTWIAVSKAKNRKTKPCPLCGKLIMEKSAFCYSCTQIGERNRRYKDGHSRRDRFCTVCGKRITSGSLKGRCSTCYSKTVAGMGNPNYRFGHYTGDLESTAEFKAWRYSVLSRDEFKCRVCGKETHALEVHHIHPKRLFPELVTSEGNGITLCKAHHKETFGKEMEFLDIFLGIIRPK